MPGSHDRKFFRLPAGMGQGGGELVGRPFKANYADGKVTLILSLNFSLIPYRKMARERQVLYI